MKQSVVTYTLAAALCLVSCGDDQPTVPTVPDTNTPRDIVAELHSGTRIKQAFYEGDGVRLRNNAFDVALEEPCTPQRWADGNYYCVPAFLRTSAYLDAQCTTPIILGAPGSGPARFSTRDIASTCRRFPDKLYKRGQRLALTTYYRRDSFSCSAVALVSQPAYAADVDLTADDLVPLRPGEIEGTSRLRLQFLLGDDGSRTSFFLHDAVLETSCSLDEQERYDAARCDPATAGTGLFSDAQCSKPLAFFIATCDQPAFALLTDASCPDRPSTRSYRRVTQRSLAQMTFFRDLDACSPSQAPEGLALYELGETVEAHALSRVVEQAPTSGRLTAIVYQDDANRVTSRTVAYDRLLRTPCRPASTPNGDVRCIPIATRVTPAYSDAQCDLPVEVVHRVGSPCAAGDVAFTVETHFQPGAIGNQTSTNVRRLQGRVAGRYYSRANGSCAPVPDGEAYAAGERIELEDLPLLRVTRDP